MGRPGGAVAAAGTEAGVGRASDTERAGHPEIAELFGKPWIQPAQREVLLHPDERQVVTSSPSRSALTTIKLAVVGPNRVDELVTALETRLPVGADGCATARVGCGSSPSGSTAHGVGSPSSPRPGILLVVPRRRRHQARPSCAGTRMDSLNLMRRPPRGVAFPASPGSRARRRRPRRRNGSSLGGRGPTCWKSSDCPAAARLVLGLQLLHVAVQLHETLLLDDAHVGSDVPAYAVSHGSPAEPASVPSEMVERHPHLPDVHHVEGEVVQVAVALSTAPSRDGRYLRGTTRPRRRASPLPACRERA